MTDLLSLYRTMVRIRAFEDAAEAASQGGVSWGGAATNGGEVRVKGPLHLSTGQEAVATGVCAHLRPTDLLTSTHRGHGHTLAKGADTTRMMCELFALPWCSQPLSARKRACRQQAVLACEVDGVVWMARHASSSWNSFEAGARAGRSFQKPKKMTTVDCSRTKARRIRCGIIHTIVNV